MNTKSIDIINIALVFISLFVAIKLPFELFLFSYAFLGPLHYLTEIVWLKERNYFIKSNKNWTTVFTIATVIISLYPIYKFIDIQVGNTFHSFMQSLKEYGSIFLLTLFLFASSLILVKKLLHICASFVICLGISILLNFYIPKALIYVSLFLPTIIHIYLFTLLFIIYGAIKAKSRYGFYLAFVVILIPFIVSYFPLEYLDYKPSKGTIDSFVKSRLVFITTEMGKILNVLENDKFILLSNAGLRIQTFIAFAYTYHYLNWFSKTSIIGWNKNLSSNQKFSIAGLWIASIALYIYDFETGFMALLILSMLHVLLEFPLNAISIKEIFSKVFSRKS